jgi:transposase
MKLSTEPAAPALVPVDIALPSSAAETTAPAVEIHVAGQDRCRPVGLRRSRAALPARCCRGVCTIPPKVAIYAAVAPADLRRSFDGVSAAARDVLGADQRGGALFLFFNRGRDRVKILWYDRSGFCLLYKRLDRGTFRLPSPLATAYRSIHRRGGAGEDPRRHRPAAGALAQDGLSRFLIAGLPAIDRSGRQVV